VTVGGIIGVVAGWAVTAVLGSLPLLDRCSTRPTGRATSPANLHVRGDHLDGIAREHWFDRRAAARIKAARLDPSRLCGTSSATTAERVGEGVDRV